GRRAVVLLTDGIDELATGGPCSTKTLEDVIALAADPAVLVPIYTIGIGNRVDSPSLSRLSDNTGGRTSFAITAASVGDIFNELGLQFRGGYALHYRTDVASGEHSLFVQVEYEGSRDQDTRRFRAPELVGQAIFSGISQDQVVTQDLVYSLEVSSSGAPDRVEFYIDDQLMSQDIEPPFEDRLPAELGEGLHTLRAVAYAPAGEVLAVAQISFVFEQPEPKPTEVPLSASISFVELAEGQHVREALTLTAAVDNQQAVARVEFRLDSFQVGEDAIPPYEVHWDPRFNEPGPHTLSVVIIGPDGSVLDVDEVSVIYDPPTSLAVIIGVPALIAAAVGGVYYFIRRRQDGRSLALGSVSPRASALPVVAATPVGSAGAEIAETLAALTVEACQDPELIGQRFEIWEEMVVIGRLSECEVVIPAQPVSRKHATIQLRAETAEASLTVDEIMLDESAASGPPPFQVFDGDPRTGQASTYGTFVDNVRAQPDAGLPLASGSRIRLGRSQAEGRVTPVILRFEDLRKPESQVAASEMTTDLLLEDGESGTGIGSAMENYGTEDFSLTDEEDDLKTEEFGPEADQ
ncbi:MAG: Ig-like domain-containing protein, partial [Anaerolineales bacterium]